MEANRCGAPTRIGRQKGRVEKASPIARHISRLVCVLPSSRWYVEGGGSHEGSTRRIELAPSKAMVSDRFICRGMLQPGCCHVAGSIRGRNFTIVRQRCGDPISVA